MLALSVVTNESKVLVVRGITVEWGVPSGAAVVSCDVDSVPRRRAVDRRSVEKAVMVDKILDLRSLVLLCAFQLTSTIYRYLSGTTYL